MGKVKVSFTTELESDAAAGFLEDLKALMPPGSKLKTRMVTEVTIEKPKRPGSTPLEDLLTATTAADRVAKSA